MVLHSVRTRQESTYQPGAGVPELRPGTQHRTRIDATQGELMVTQIILVLIFLVFLAPLPASASPVPVGRKAFVKETNKILSQYNEELVAYGQAYHPGVDGWEIGLYVQRAMVDFLLVQTDLQLYTQHKRTQDDVSTSLRQLSRDIEDVPPPADIH